MSFHVSWKGYLKLNFYSQEFNNEEQQRTEKVWGYYRQLNFKCHIKVLSKKSHKREALSMLSHYLNDTEKKLIINSIVINSMLTL